MSRYTCYTSTLGKKLFGAGRCYTSPSTLFWAEWVSCSFGGIGLLHAEGSSRCVPKVPSRSPVLVLLPLPQPPTAYLHSLALVAYPHAHPYLQSIVSKQHREANGSFDRHCSSSQMLWWSHLSRQFLVKNKIKHNRSRILVLSARIYLRWCLIV